MCVYIMRIYMQCVYVCNVCMYVMCVCMQCVYVCNVCIYAYMCVCMYVCTYVRML